MSTTKSQGFVKSSLINSDYLKMGQLRYQLSESIKSSIQTNEGKLTLTFHPQQQ